MVVIEILGFGHFLRGFEMMAFLPRSGF